MTQFLRFAALFCYLFFSAITSLQAENYKDHNTRHPRANSFADLPAPANIRYSSLTTNSVVLKWNAVSGATNYDVYKNGVLVSTIATDSLVIINLSSATVYQLEVRAKNDVDVSPGASISILTRETPEQHNSRMQWWRNAKFGMFIHWGMYASLAGCYNSQCLKQGDYGEWIFNNLKVPVTSYRDYGSKFTASNYSPQQWVNIAKQAGMKYMVVTSKHHEGFALFNSAVSNWNAVQSSAAARDLIAPLTTAARDSGLHIGLYYSQALDWVNGGSGGKWDPLQNERTFDQYIDQIGVPQVKEILGNYGPIDVLWWDFPLEMTEARAQRYMSAVNEKHAQQPGLLFNNRLGDGFDGDFSTPEQSIPDVPPTGYADKRDWESCMTLNDTWGYMTFDHHWKSTHDIISKLVDIVSKGGNFLLNVGPKADGTFPPEIVSRLDSVGKWMDVNSEAIYETTANPFPEQLPWGRCTKKVTADSTILYLHVFDWPTNGKLSIPGLNNRIDKAYLINNKSQNLTATYTSTGCLLAVPTTAPGTISSTVVVVIKDALQVSRVPIYQTIDGSFELPPGKAEIHGSICLEKKSNIENLGCWGNADDWLSWGVNVTKRCTFVVKATVACPSRGTFILSVNGTNRNFNYPSTGGFDDQNFQHVTLGTIDISTSGIASFVLKRIANGWNPVNIRSISFEPLVNDTTDFGVFKLLPQSAIISGNLCKEKKGAFENIGCWINETDSLLWKINVADTGTYKVKAFTAAANEGKFKLNIGAENQLLPYAATTGMDTANYVLNEIGTVKLTSTGIQLLAITRLINGWNPVNVSYFQLENPSKPKPQKPPVELLDTITNTLSFYPNPSSGNVNIRITSAKECEGKIYVTEIASGVQKLYWTGTLTNGENNIPITINKIGAYAVNAFFDKKNICHKLIINK